MDDLHVLVLPSWYTDRLSPARGIFFFEQAKALRRGGVRVGVVAPIQRSVRTFMQGRWFENRFAVHLGEEAGVPTLRSSGWAIPRLPRARRWLWLRQARHLISHYFRRYGRPHLIHAHSAIWAGVAALQASREFGIPYVVTEHSTAFARGLVQPWQRRDIESVLHGASRRIAVSHAMAKQIAPYALGRCVEVIPNMVDMEFFRPPPKSRPLRPFRFLTVARLAEHKGIDVLLKAFAAVLGSTKDAYLEIGGRGVQQPRLEKLSRELQIASRVVFLGALSRDGVREALWRANAFVLPSYVETFGVVLIEAMATGLPVITTRCGGPEEFVTAEAGFVLEPGDAKGLAEAMVAICDNEHWSQVDLCNRIRESTKERFGSTAVVSHLVTLYRSVLSESGCE